MPKRTFTENDIKRIASKYIKSVTRDPAKVPNIQQIITEAFQKAVPGKPVDSNDITTVIQDLTKRTTISDKVIQEAVKRVVDQGAINDLKFMIAHHAKRLGFDATPEEIDDIIQYGKLNPLRASLPKVRQTVEDYYRTHNKAQRPAPSPAPTPVKDEGGTLVKPKKISSGKFVRPQDPNNLTFFEKIRLKMRRYGLKSLSRAARNWLTDNVALASRPPGRKRLLNEGESLAEALVGKMFMYFYDAKTKEDLPYWDKFPLIFVIELYKDGWLGLNLHYLDRNLRLKLFDKLLEFANNKSLDKITKLKLSYALLKNVSQYPEVRPCIKRYLSTQVKSDLVVVEPVDWETALFIPVEQFQKQPKERVWADSRNFVRKWRKKRQDRR